jgi:hypothetical protein
MSDNPFEILRLDPSATEAEIVRQAGQLRQIATEEATRNAIRRAVQSLTARAEDRMLYALLTHPSPGYRAPALDRFLAAFRRPPTGAGNASDCPALDIKEFEELLKEECVKELDPPPLVFEVIAGDENGDEIRRQTAEVSWQSLLFDSRG